MGDDDSLDLFAAAPSGAAAVAAAGGPGRHAPLADRMRPRTLDEVAGQEHLVAEGAPLRALARSGALPSLILWGPPGTGKTTLARLLADAPGARFVPFSAVTVGVKEIREVVEAARRDLRAGRRTVLFLDEIHRFNRAQQDVLLPHVEAGTVTLIGATTENPSFEVNSALLSRTRVFTLRRLEPEALAALVRRAAADAERGLAAADPHGLALSDDAVGAIADAADGDARRALGLLEAAATLHRSEAPPGAPLPPSAVERAAGERVLAHDRDRDAHYDVVSALIKSLRASDPDAALYYMARMLAAGEDPLFVARRLLIFASEDVGNADPVALAVALGAFQAVERIGLPEGRIPLAQAVTWLACAPKSNAAYRAGERAAEAALAQGSLPVPLHLRNAPTGLMKSLGYGKGYRYPHDAEDGFVPDPNLPPALGDPVFYEPTREGAEAALADRLGALRTRRARARRKPAPPAK